MNRRIRTRLAVTVGITLLSIFLVMGLPPSLAGMRQNLRLGLDLRGGTQLVLQVQVEDAIRANTDQTIGAIEEQMKKDGIIFRQMARTQDDEFQARGVDPVRDREFRNMIFQEPHLRPPRSGLGPVQLLESFGISDARDAYAYTAAKFQWGARPCPE